MSDDHGFQKQLARLQHRYNLEYQMIQATAAFEHAALRTLFFLNGGAAVAFTALYGAVKPPDASAYYYQIALIYWILGLVFAAIATFFGARSQFNFRKLRGTETTLEEMKMGLLPPEREGKLILREKTYSSVGQSSRFAAVVAGCLSLLTFILALVPAFNAVR